MHKTHLSHTRPCSSTYIPPVSAAGTFGTISVLPLGVVGTPSLHLVGVASCSGVVGVASRGGMEGVASRGGVVGVASRGGMEGAPPLLFLTLKVAVLDDPLIMATPSI